MRGKLLGADERLVIVTDDGQLVTVDRESGADVYEAFDAWTQVVGSNDRNQWDAIEEAAEEYLQGGSVSTIRRELMIPGAVEAIQSATTPQPTTEDLLLPKHPYQIQREGLEACGFPGCGRVAGDSVHDWLDVAEKSYTLTHADGTKDEVVRMSERVAMATNRENAAHGNPWRYEETKTAGRRFTLEIELGGPVATAVDVAELLKRLHHELREDGFTPGPHDIDTRPLWRQAEDGESSELVAHTVGKWEVHEVPEPIQTVSLAAVCPKQFAVVNLATDDQPTGFDTLEEARMHVMAVSLTDWEIWDGDTLVEHRDPDTDKVKR